MDQRMRQGVGAFVEFAVGECPIRGPHGDRVRAPPDLGCEEAGETVGPGAGCRLAHPGGHGLPSLLRRLEEGGREQRLRLVDERVEEVRPVSDPTFHPGGVEEIGRELGRDGRAGRETVDPQGQVELGGAQIGSTLRDAQPGKTEGVVREPVIREEGLEQRVVARIPLEAEPVHESFERILLMRQRAHAGCADPAKHLAQRRFPAEIGAEREGVHEDANGGFVLDPLPVGDGGADHEVRLPAVPGEQDLEGS